MAMYPPALLRWHPILKVISLLFLPASQMASAANYTTPGPKGVTVFA
jgi:hypothetical protein